MTTDAAQTDDSNQSAERRQTLAIPRQARSRQVSERSNSNEEAANGIRLAKARVWKHVMVVSDPPTRAEVQELADKLDELIAVLKR